MLKQTMKTFLFIFVNLIFLSEFTSAFKIDLEEDLTDHARLKRQATFQKTNEEYETCTNSFGQSGYCKPVLYCRLPELNNNVWRIINELCIIEKSSIGICCPDTFDQGNAISVPEIIPNNEITQIANTNRFDDATRIVNTPAKRGCGTTTKQFPRIAGGRPAEKEEWPWMAAILHHDVPHIHCGGVLVTDKYVLTAAHCIQNYDKNDLFVRMGEYDFRLLNETRSRNFKITKMVLHEDYDHQRYQNDIALIQVERPTLFNTYIWNICLPPPQADATSSIWEGWNAIVTGWGTTSFAGPHSNVLMEVNVPVWKHKECENLFVEHIDETLLCAGNVDGAKDSCQGDSGGPLMVQLPNRRWIVIGIVSWGVRCGEAQPGIYTRIDKYVPWILEHSVD